MNGPIKKILIVGGGTSGWMTACLLTKRVENVEITLVESSDIPTVGVGEATIIQMNYFLQEMGLKEKDWMPSCNATYKEGIYFQDFYQKGAHYWHPFQVANLEVTDYWIHKYYKDRLSVDSYFDYCYSNTAWNSILIGMRMIPLPEVFRPINLVRYAAANKAMEDNLRKAKRQAVGYADGVKNPSHYEYLSETVYKDIESE